MDIALTRDSLLGVEQIPVIPVTKINPVYERLHHEREDQELQFKQDSVTLSQEALTLYQGSEII